MNDSSEFGHMLLEFSSVHHLNLNFVGMFSPPPSAFGSSSFHSSRKRKLRNRIRAYRWISTLSTSTSIISSTLLHSMSVQQQYSLSHSISVNKATCDYIGVIKFNTPNANLPFPDCLTAGPPPPDTKAPPSYKFSTEFYKATGFDHLGMDWQPCGHPAIENFGKPHFDFHLYRITSAQRDLMSCDIITGAPICAFPGGPPPDAQSTFAGKKFFAVGKVTAGSDDGNIANMPELFTVDLGSAVPHSGIHVYDIGGAVDVDQWTDPVLIIGSYDSQIVNWEPMFPYTFVSGDTP